MTGYFKTAGVEQGVIDQILGAMQFIDQTKLITLAISGGFSEGGVAGAPVDLAKVINNDLVQAALVQAKIDVAAMASDLGVSYASGDGPPTTAPTTAAGSTPLIASMATVTMLSAICVM